MTDGPPVLTVVVLYRESFEASKTLAGLTQAVAEDPDLLRSFDLLVWDNSPAPLESAVPFPFRYHHAGRNEGVAGAYNGAARLAHEQGARWLLLFDHDTSVTGDFLRGMRQHAEQAEDEERIAAVAPYLHAGEFVVSPRCGVLRGMCRCRSRPLHTRSGGSSLPPTAGRWCVWTR